MSKDKLWRQSPGAQPPRKKRELTPEQLDEQERDVRVSRMGLVFGLIVSVLLGAALVVPAAKAGITPGVSPVVVLFGWVAFGAALGPGLKRFLAIAQVTGSGGAAVTAGVVFTAPVLQIIASNQGAVAPAVNIGLLTLGSVSGALLGFGFVGFATSRFLTDKSLPAPEAVACDRMIRTAVEKPDERPALGLSLVAGLIGGAIATLVTNFNWIAANVHSFTLRVFARGDAAPDVSIPIPVSPIYLGIGALLTLPTAILIFAGGLVNSFTQGYSASHALPGTTYRWVGGAAMTVAVLYSLVMYVVEGRRKAKADHEKSAARHDMLMAAAKADTGPRVGVPELTTFPDWQLRQSRGIKQLLWACIWAGFALLLLMLKLLGASWLHLGVLGAVALVLAFLLSGLGGLLSLQVGASASPVSGTVFMGLLVLSVTALAIGLEGLNGVAILVPLVVATCVAICAANDSSQDYKTVQLNGFKVTDSFPGHLVGLLAGALVVPATLSMADSAFHLGSANLPCPQAGFFSTVLQSLFLKADIPWGPVGFGACLGLLAVGMDAIGRRRGLILSALAFAVGIYLTPAAGVGMMLGALARWLPKRKLGASTHEGVLIAAGLITGEAICQLVLGGLILSKVTLPDGGADGTDLASRIVGPILLVVILALIYRNNAKGRAAEGAGH